MAVMKNYAEITGSICDLYPSISAELNEAKTGRTAETLTPKSSVKAWWTCPNGHEYQAPVARRTSGSGCAYCSNTKVLAGFNDLATSNPVIAAELDEEKSGFSVNSIMGGSSKKAWWKCRESHSWEASISSRAKNGRGCPFCSGHRTLPEKSMAVLYPEIAKWFDAEKSGLTAEEVAPVSHKNLWWYCEHGHSYQQMPQNKTRQNDGCPVCSGRYASEENNLSSLHPSMAQEFDEAKNGFSADCLTPGSKVSVWWKCSEYGHSWKVSPASRNKTVQSRRKTNHVAKSLISKKDSGCPFCANFYVLKGFNDFATVHPALSLEFDSLKTGFGADTFTSGSTRLVWWQCLKLHSWQASVSARALRGHGCPECSGANSSKIEVAFRKSFVSLAGWEVGDESNAKVTLFSPKGKRLMIDIEAAVDGKKVIVEYDGYYYHSGAFKNDRAVRIARDIKKTELLLANGYCVIRIREHNANGRLDFLPMSHVRLFQIEHEYKGQRVDHSRFLQDTIDRIDKWIKSF